MKKNLFLFLTSLVLFCSCNGCTKEKKEVVVPTNLNVENVTATDKEYMFANYGEKYDWFETCIVLKDFLDADSCDGTITGVSNVFEVVDAHGTSADVFVVLAAHTPDTTVYDVKHGFWVEDLPMNNIDIAVPFDSAFVKLQQANCPKPHSKQCVLRKQLGPVNTNPQYIFGNTHAQVYVDAVTGDVNTNNPVFPEGFKMPLGEWP